MLALDGEALLDALEARVAEERRPGRALISETVSLAPLDAAALVFASRLASDRYFCWQEPDRGFALCGVGAAHEAVSRGPGRFADIAASCAELSRRAVPAGEQELPRGAGVVFVGGFSFAPEGGGSASWSSFPPALMVLPEVSVCCTEGSAYLTVNAVLDPRSDPGEVMSRLRARLASLRSEALPLLDPHRYAHTEIRNTRAPHEFEAAVAALVARIEAGELKKAVLAREISVLAPGAFSPAAVFGALRELFPSCFCFCCGSPEGAFLGASPELLVSRTGGGAQAVALAGSARRSSDPAVDDHLGQRLLQSPKDRREHEIVARRITRALRQHAVWVQAEPEPTLAKVANIQHLATPIHAQLAQAHSAIELAGMLHPTPAVGGEPWAQAERAISELEHLDRGWYAGPVGWTDALEDGEFCVALRSALLRDREALLFAGVGVVEGSDPGAELAETELKLEAVLPLLAA